MNLLIMRSLALAIQGAISQGLLWGVMALGVYITFRILDYADMTCDGSFAFGGCISATLIVGHGWNPFLSLIIATIAGMLAGAVTGVLHTKFKIPAVLSGILTMIALYSINIRIMGQSNTPLLGVDTIVSNIVKVLPTSITSINNINAWVTMALGILFTFATIIILYWFFGTEIGCALRATGNNEDMVRALGANTDTMKILGLVIGNGLVGLSGALVAQSQGYADVGMGTGTIVIGLASIVIGGVVFGKRYTFAYKLMSVVIGSVLYRIIIAVVLQVGMKSSDLKLLTAIIVTIALSVPVIRKNRVQRKNNQRKNKTWKKIKNIFKKNDKVTK